eukprot:6184547-Pleurochrysis_carterae.AAC.2
MSATAVAAMATQTYSNKQPKCVQVADAWTSIVCEPRFGQVPGGESRPAISHAILAASLAQPPRTGNACLPFQPEPRVYNGNHFGKCLKCQHSAITEGKGLIDKRVHAGSKFGRLLKRRLSLPEAEAWLAAVEGHPDERLKQEVKIAIIQRRHFSKSIRPSLELLCLDNPTLKLDGWQEKMPADHAMSVELMGDDLNHSTDADSRCWSHFGVDVSTRDPSPTTPNMDL